MFDPIDSNVKEIMGNVHFLDNLFSRTSLILGTAGVIGVVLIIVFVLR